MGWQGCFKHQIEHDHQEKNSHSNKNPSANLWAVPYALKTEGCSPDPWSPKTLPFKYAQTPGSGNSGDPTVLVKLWPDPFPAKASQRRADQAILGNKSLPISQLSQFSLPAYDNENPHQIKILKSKLPRNCGVFFPVFSDESLHLIWPTTWTIGPNLWLRCCNLIVLDSCSKVRILKSTPMVLM